MLRTNPVTVLPGGRYRLIREIGRGGLGVVYEAYDRLKGETVALKRMKLGEAHGSTQPEGDSRALLMLAQEFSTGARLRHRHIVPLLDYGFDGDQPYFTMMLVPGAQPLLPYLASQPTQQQARVLGQFLRALAYLHRCGIIHRDIKPGNILVDADDQGLIVDFGIAIHTTTAAQAETAGTLLYSSPELVSGKTPSISSDLWSVGVVLYELFAGRNPFAQGGGNVVLRIMRTQIDFDPLPPSIAEIVRGLLQKHPHDRLPQAAELVEAISAALGLPADAAVVDDRESYLSAAPFTGRAEEFNRLAAVLDGSGPPAVLLGGESGVGKSRLIEEVRLAALVKGWLVVRGYAAEEAANPFTLWAEPVRRLLLSLPHVEDDLAAILKAVVPDIDLLLQRPVALAEPLPPREQARRLADAIFRVMADQPQPVLLLLEDLQWADDALAPLNLLLDRIAALPVRIIASFRNDEAPDLPEKLPGMVPIMLTRLPETAISELAGAMVGAAPPAMTEWLMAETEGNVFFLVETLRDLAEEFGGLGEVAQRDLPVHVLAGGVAALLQRRLARIPPAHQPMLRAAALYGRILDLALLNRLGEAVEDFIAACARAAVIEWSDGAWRFAHDKLRAAAQAGLSDGERLSLHRTLAQALQAEYGSEPARAPAIFEQYYAAGMVAEAAALVPAAGTYLLDISATTAAVAVYERGLALAETLNDLPLRALVLERLAEAYASTADFARSMQTAKSAIEAAEALNDRAMLRLALFTAANSAVHLHHQSAVDAYAERLRLMALEDHDPLAHVQALTQLGYSALSRGAVDEAHDRFQQVVDAGLANDGGPTKRSRYGLGICALLQGRHEEARSHLFIVLEQQRKSSNLLDAASCMAAIGHTYYFEKDYEACLRYEQGALGYYERVNQPQGIARTINNMAETAIKLEQFQTAFDYSQRAIAIFTRTGALFSYLLALKTSGIALLYMGRHREALDFFLRGLRESRSPGEINLHEPVLYHLGGIARVRLATDDSLGAAELAGLIESQMETAPQVKAYDFPPLLASLQEVLPAETLEAALAHGRTLSLDQRIGELLADDGLPTTS